MEVNKPLSPTTAERTRLEMEAGRAALARRRQNEALERTPAELVKNTKEEPNKVGQALGNGGQPPKNVVVNRPAQVPNFAQRGPLSVAAKHNK